MSQDFMVSVIIPVYQGEKFLNQCIDSVLNQTHEKIEVICVNDGSKDQSLEILREYERKDQRVRVFSQDNRGQSAARNLALSHAKGKFVVFIDSDDYIGKDYIKELYDEIIKERADMVVCGYTKVDMEGKILFSKVIEGAEKRKDPIFPLTYISWNRIISRDLIVKNGFTYWEGVQCEDIPFILKLETAAKKVSYIKGTQYYYRTNTNSTTEVFKKKGIPREKIPFAAIKESVEYSKKYRNRFTEKQLEYYVCRILTTLIFELGKKSDPAIVLELCDYSRKILRTYYPEYNKNPYIKMRSLKEVPVAHRMGVFLFAFTMKTKCIKPFALLYTRF